MQTIKQLLRGCDPLDLYYTCVHHALTESAINAGADMDMVEPSINRAAHYAAKNMRSRGPRGHDEEFSHLMHAEIVKEPALFSRDQMRSFMHGDMCRRAKNALPLYLAELAQNDKKGRNKPK